MIGEVRSPDVTRLSHFLERNAIPFRVVDPDQDRDASSLLARFAPNPEDLPVAVLSDGTVKCWGGNLYDQLGNGKNLFSLVPVNVITS